MKTIPAVLILILASGALKAQLIPVPPGPPVTAPLLLQNPGSQPNTPGGALVIAATLTGDGQQLGALAMILAETDPSITIGWALDPNDPVQYLMNVQGWIQAQPQTPFTLAMSVTPGTLPCCTFAPWLPADVPLQGLGRVHLDVTATPILDGLGLFGGSPLPAATDGSGRFPLFGSLALATPGHVTLQGLVIDPSEPAGVRLTAALAITKLL